jgi:hypothetical protein
MVLRALHSFRGGSTVSGEAPQFPGRLHRNPGALHRSPGRSTGFCGRGTSFTSASGSGLGPSQAVSRQEKPRMNTDSRSTAGAEVKGVFLNRRKQRKRSFLVPLRSLFAPVELPGYGLAVFIRLGTGESRGRGEPLFSRQRNGREGSQRSQRKELSSVNNSLVAAEPRAMVLLT